MPKAPTVPGPQVQTEALPGVRMAPNVSPDQFGAGVAQGVQDVGRVFGQIAQQERAIRQQATDQANNAAVNDYSSQIGTLATKYQIEHQNLKGQAALEAEPDLLDRFNKEAENIGGGMLSNPEQREQAKHILLRHTNSLKSAMAVYSNGEVKKQQAHDYVQNNETETGRAELNRNDPQQVASAWAATQASTDAFAKANRWGPDVLANARTTDATRFWGRQSESFLNEGDDIQAQRILDQHKADMDGAAVARLQDAISKTKDRNDVKRVTTVVMGWNDGDPATPPDLEKAMADVDSFTKGMKPEVIDDAKAMVARNLRLRYEAHNDTQAGIEYQILSAANDPQNPAGFDSKPVQALWRQLDPIRAAKVKAAMTKIEQPDPISSRMALRNYELLLTSPDPAVRQRVQAASPAEIVAGGGMTPEDAKQAVDLWYKAKQAKAGDATAQRELEGLQTKGDAVMTVLRAGGLDLKKDGDGNYDPKTAAALDWVDREGKAMQAARADRKPLTSDDWKVLAGKALVEQKLKGAGFWGGDQSKTTAQMQADLVGQIPAQHRAGIEEAFNATHGRMPTYPELLSAWAVYQQAHPEVKPLPTVDEKKQRAADATRATMFFGHF